MVSVWNSRLGQCDGAGSLAPGVNLDRRRFVELAAGAVAGVTLVGLPAPAAAEADGRPVDAPCSGKGRGGPAAEVLEYEDLVVMGRAWR